MSEETERKQTTGPSRRGFMGVATLAIGGVMSAVLAVPLLRFFFHPAGKTVVTGSGTAVDAIGIAELASGADPVKVSLVASGVRDAWATADSVRLGAAWVTRKEDGSVSAFTSACPHLGCSIDFDSDAKTFKCPCHRSAFTKNGDRIEGPSKRGLDPLPAKVVDGRVLITHQRFETDIADRVEKA